MSGDGPHVSGSPDIRSGSPDIRSGSPDTGSAVDNEYVLSVDVGTTILCCHIYDRHANIKGTSRQKVSKKILIKHRSYFISVVVSDERDVAPW